MAMHKNLSLCVSVSACAYGCGCRSKNPVSPYSKAKLQSTSIRLMDHLLPGSESSTDRDQGGDGDISNGYVIKK